MPWKPGIGSRIYQNVGRKGYELEEKDKQRLTKLLLIGIKLGEKMAQGEATIKEQMAYGNIEKLVLKLLDKFVPSKLQGDFREEIDLSAQVQLDNETQKLLKDFITWRKSKL